MTRLSTIASAFAFAALAGCATTGPSGSLRQVADQVEAARTASGNKDFSKIPPLAASVPTLDAIIAAKSDESLTAAAHYYRGEIASLTNQQNFRERHAFDPALAQEAVTEYGDTLIYGRNMPEWRIYLPDVAYRRGSAAYVGGFFDAALESYRLCAAAGHGGCMNSVAVILMRGTPNDQNLTEAFNAFRAAVTTGSTATCAGSFSAESAALFIHFKVVNAPAGDEYDWVNQARHLANAAQQQTGFSDPCHGIDRIG
jgi:TPR repeat protein